MESLSDSECCEVGERYSQNPLIACRTKEGQRLLVKAAGRAVVSPLLGTLRQHLHRPTLAAPRPPRPPPSPAHKPPPPRQPHLGAAQLRSRGQPTDFQWPAWRLVRSRQP